MLTKPKDKDGDKDKDKVGDKDKDRAKEKDDGKAWKLSLVGFCGKFELTMVAVLYQHHLQHINNLFKTLHIGQNK